MVNNNEHLARTKRLLIKRFIASNLYTAQQTRLNYNPFHSVLNMYKRALSLNE